MKKKSNFCFKQWVALLALALLNNDVWAADYKFESYPATAVKKNVQVKPILNSKLAKKYKTIITLEAKEPINFAGHYRVAVWGCGTDCRGFVIINKQTGDVYSLPDVEYVAGVMGNDEDRLSFKPDSRLFIITGIKNDDELQEGKFYYVWSDSHLKLLAKTPIKKEDFSLGGQ